MNNAGVKISDDPEVRRSLVTDNGETLLAIWTNAVPKIVQEEIDNFDAASLFDTPVPGNLGATASRVLIRAQYQNNFPGLKNLFQFAWNLSDYEYELKGRRNWWQRNNKYIPLVEILAPGHIEDSYTFHLDRGEYSIPSSIATVCVMRSGSDAQGGEFEYVDKEDAPRALQLEHDSPSLASYICTDESVIQKASINSVMMLVNGQNNDRGQVHRGTATQNGCRWRITTVRVGDLVL